ncbi:MAG: thiol-disulfide oxidoreductase DCC family protein [Bacteroidia bacterium]
MNKNCILLFDGECNLCNKSVQFVIKRDKRGRVKFALLQSNTGKKLKEQYQIQKSYFNSIILIDNEKVYYKSTAVLRLSKYLEGLWPVCYTLIIIPKFIRDTVYDYIARNRIKWFGRTDSCWVITEELTKRFL